MPPVLTQEVLKFSKTSHKLTITTCRKILEDSKTDNERANHNCTPSVHHRHNAGLVSCDLLEGRHGHVEMMQREVAPSAVVFRQGGIRRAEVGDSNLNSWAVRAALGGTPRTLHLVARTACEATVEKS